MKTIDGNMENICFNSISSDFSRQLLLIFFSLRKPWPVDGEMEKRGEIGAVNFYGAKAPLAAGIREEKGRKAALQAIRRDESRVYRIFPTQAQAFEFADAGKSIMHPLRIWAYEIDGKGRRRFVVAPYESFWRWYRRCLRRNPTPQLHFYEIIRQGYACKLYFDLEYLFEHNAHIRPELCLENLLGAIKDEAKMSKISWMLLDSCTEKKWSKHVIINEIGFYDNIQAGEFVTRIIKRMDSSCLVKDPDGREAPFIDASVYSRNRCFRLVGSSKFGKTARLLPENHPKDAARLSIPEQLFYNSLVCNVSATAKLFGSPRTTDEYFKSPYKTHEPRGSSDNYNSNNAAESSHEKENIDKYIMSIVSKNGGGIHAVTSLNGALSYAIKGGYKYCGRIGRHHKSNNVILIVDVKTRTGYQKCFDPDCSQYCSDGWEIPAWVFPEVKAGKNEVPGDEIEQFMDELDERILEEAKPQQPSAQSVELTDELLNTVMDCFEATLPELRQGVHY